MSESRNVVVLGTGGAGLTAAIAAHDFGAAAPRCRWMAGSSRL